MHQSTNTETIDENQCRLHDFKPRFHIRFHLNALLLEQNNNNHLNERKIKLSLLFITCFRMIIFELPPLIFFDKLLYTFLYSSQKLF